MGACHSQRALAIRLSHHYIACTPHHQSRQGVRAASIISERLWGRAQLLTSLVLTVHPHSILMLQLCSCMAHQNPKGQWHVMVSSGTPGDSVQLLRLSPTQTDESSTAGVPEAGQPPAQLDAESQGQRRSGAHVHACLTGWSSAEVRIGAKAVRCVYLLTGFCLPSAPFKELLTHIMTDIHVCLVCYQEQHPLLAIC